MSKWACYYHAVWATDQRAPTLIGPRTEAMGRMIAAICRDLGCKAIAIGSQPDHVHLAISIPPRLSVSTVIGRLKGATSHALRDVDLTDPPWTGWQSEFGVFTFSERSLKDVTAYVSDQERRHRTNRIIAEYEPE
jgi:putative transposase